MALVTLNMESRFLQGSTTISLLLPDEGKLRDGGKRYRVLWLLHGTGGDHSDYIRKTSLERYVQGKDLVVVMPSALNSDYVNWNGFATGFSMEDFMIQELVPFVRHWLPVSDAPKDNFIAGLSMGGRGALMLGLKWPQYFGAIGSMSFVPYRLEHDRQAPALPAHRMENVIANSGGWEDYLSSSYNLWERLLKQNEQDHMPPIYLSMGDKDFYYPYWQEFSLHPAAVNQAVCRRLVQGYGHEWAFWDKELPNLLDFFCRMK